METGRDSLALRLGLPIAVAVLAFLAFTPCLRADFVNWDDDVNITQNPWYRGLSSEHLKWMFTTFQMGHYQPLTWMTLGLDYMLWGMNPAGYHLTSLLLHAANAALAYLVFLGILRRTRAEGPDALRWAVAAGALFYAIHPLRVESVAWVTERRDVLCGFFLLLSILAYLRMERTQREGGGWGAWLALSCAAFAASLLSKALGIMLPFALLVLDIFPLGRFRSGARARVLLEKAPFLVLAVADGVVMLLSMSHIDAVRPAGGYAPGDRLLQAAYGLWFYAWKSAVPAGLSPLYALADQASLWRAEYIGPLLGAGAITATLVALRRKWPAGLAAWTAYAVLLFPVLGFFVSGYQRAADRYSYLSCLPLSLLAAAGAARLAPHGRLGGIGIGSGLAALGVLTFLQTGIWKDSFTLWDHVLRSEQRADLPYVNRGSARRDRGDLDGALADYAQALRVNPRSADALNNRGQIRQQRGDLAGALADYDQALSINPKMAEGFNNRASLKTLTKDWEGALSDSNEALKLNPAVPETWAIRGNARLARGDPEGAISDFETALRLAAPAWTHRKTVERMREDARKRRAGPR